MAKKTTVRKKKVRTSRRAQSAAKPLHDVRFPGESTKYRAARNALLREEMALRSQIEAVAAKRRRLPPGGVVPEDYTFDEIAADGSVRSVRLSELFAPGKDTLIVYSYMFGPRMAAPCVSCTSILDGLDGQSLHVNQRVNFVAVAKSPIERVMSVARERGWDRLRLLSSAHNMYNRDYHGENEKGDQLPSLNVFVKRNGRIHHFYQSELLFAPSTRGQDGRHVDLIWPLWNLFDVTPEGRGTEWYPRLRY
ncbi:MAG TPA: DUF899 family protein [Vicinamibacterales bacterium]|nr:DUF899 family protein [Vicinamibacterales bacterium]